MGLDAVELVMSVEEVFGIELPDEDAAHLTTPRKLIDYVCAKVSATSSETCLSQRSFYRVRRILAYAANIDRRAIRPSTGLDDVLPRTERQRRWSELAREIGVSRRLTRPRWVIRAGLCLCALGFVGASLLVPERPLMAGSMTSAALGALLALITRPMAVRLQVTAGALAVEAIPAVLSADGGKGSAKWTQEGVAETCRRLIREQLGLEDFSDDAEFIRDLGMG